MNKGSFIILCFLAIFILSSCDKEEVSPVSASTASADEEDEIIVVREVPRQFKSAENVEETTGGAETEIIETEEENANVVEENVTENETKQDECFSKSEITDEIKSRITGLSYSADCTVPYEDLRYLRVMYVDFTGSDRTGEIVCNKAIADDLLEIFKGLYDARYEIDKIRLIDEYGADDDLSCADDNTSCFCFRKVYGSRNLSKHALGMAVDINPFYNPYVTYPDGKIRISPPGSEPYADRNADFPHKIDKNDLAYKLFTAHGFKWGGDWNSLKDYQHFQKG